MEKIKGRLIKTGYKVLNVDYPSTDYGLEALAEKINKEVSSFNPPSTRRLHFVTYSMGGLVARALIKKYRPGNLGQVVMLGPPNQGSEMADFLKDNVLFQKFYGPAGQELGTHQESIRALLGDVDFNLGVIAGDRSIDPIGSFLIPGSDDGKVSVEHTKLKGMKDHIIIHATHTFMMKNEEVISQILHFLETGRFKREKP
ncbi:MAG: hypothetical protein NPINA01_24720 [Nitrospinaceae bacterium]|nr:MAG: hypothetical protein NPINA01_24720 [Nitrospinaceae bacterium]